MEWVQKCLQRFLTRGIAHFNSFFRNCNAPLFNYIIGMLGVDVSKKKKVCRYLHYYVEWLFIYLFFCLYNQYNTLFTYNSNKIKNNTNNKKKIITVIKVYCINVNTLSKACFTRPLLVRIVLFNEAKICKGDGNPSMASHLKSKTENDN